MLLRMHPRGSVLQRKGLKQTLAFAFVLCCLFTAQLLRVAHLYSVNWDEAHHLYDGYRILTLHDFRANAEVPPLLKVAAALPILRMHPALPQPEGNSQTQSAFLEGRSFVFGNGGDRLIFPARLVCIAFTLALAILVYAAASSFFGPMAGLLALLLFTFDPLVLAHGALISTDIASALFLFATVLAFHRYTTHTRSSWLLLTGLLAGLAVTAKFTGILAVPILVLLVFAEAVRTRSPRLLVSRLLACVAVLGFAIFVLWASYGFHDAPAPQGLPLSPTLDAYIASLPHPGDVAKLTFAARLHLLPQAYLWGLADTRHKEWDFASYFLGHIYRHGPWQYFPVAFLVKSTLPFLLLLAVAPWALRSRDLPPGTLATLLLPPTVYLAVIMSSHFDIGARHLLPVYPFLYVLVAGAGLSLARRRLAWAWGLGALALWQVVTSVRIAPDYMAYGNEAIGGPLEVRRYLSDANVDWGQQLKTVRQYLDAHPIEDCWFAYFPDGAVQPEDYGVRCHRLPTPSALWWFNLPMTVPSTVSGTVLISESVLDGVESGDGVLNPYDSFHTVRPVAVLQHGVYVYQGTFAVPLAAAWVHVRDANQLAANGHAAEALKAAEQAVAVAPTAARVQLCLAQRLAAVGRVPDATAHFRLAEQLLQQQRPDLQGDELRPAIQAGLQQVATHP